MGLTDKDIKEIEREAEKLYPILETNAPFEKFRTFLMTNHNVHAEIARKGYIAGAKSQLLKQREREQKLVEALEKIRVTHNGRVFL